ncbi:MAG: thioredoxin [Deltaproteobacteria bacterium]|nr:thioredoxin [Deltaproteobacteria bacterium]
MAQSEASAVPYVDERSFEREILMSELPVLVEYTAAWCGPCKTIAPDVEAIARELQGKAKVVKVDVDKCQAIAQQLRIQSVPTFMVFAGGRPVAAKVGALRRAQMRQLLEPFLPRAEGAVKPAEALELHKQGKIVFVDTRDAPSFGRAHLPGAVNMPIAEIETRLAELHMMAGAPVLYCRSGKDTQPMAEKLAEAGVPVAFLEGGLLAWEAEGLGVERPD